MGSKEECQFYTEGDCIADMINCDFKGEDYKKCLRYRVYFLKPQSMQLR